MYGFQIEKKKKRKKEKEKIASLQFHMFVSPNFLKIFQFIILELIALPYSGSIGLAFVLIFGIAGLYHSSAV